MAKFDAKVRKCFAAATSISDADAKKLASLAEKYASGDEAADYASAVSDEIARYTGLIDQIVSKAKGGDAKAPAAKQEQPTPEPAAPVADKTVTVGRKGREQQVNQKQLLQLINNASGKDRARILARTGFDLDQDPDNGAPILVQVSNPRSLQEVADEEGVSRQAVDQSLKKFGITDDVVNALAGTFSAETVTTEELGIDPAADGSGFRIEDDVSKTAGQGLVDDGTTQSADQKARSAEADAMLAETGTKGKRQGDAYDAATDPTRAKRTAEADAALKRDVAELLSGPNADLMALDWNDYKSDGTPDFEALPPALQYAWLVEYKAFTKENGNANDTAIEQFQRGFERDNGATPGTVYEADGGGAGPTVRESSGPASAARANRSGQTAGGEPGVARTRRDRPNQPDLRAGRSAEPSLIDFGAPSAVVLDDKRVLVVEIDDRDGFIAANPGVASGLKKLADAGLDGALDMVDKIFVSPTALPNGIFGAVRFNEETNNLELILSTAYSEGRQDYTLRHEVGHIVDGAFGRQETALDKYSGRPEVKFSPNGTAIGEVAREAMRLMKTDSDMATQLFANMDPVRKKNPARASEELVADIFAVALRDPMKLPPAMRKFALEMLADAKANFEGNIRQARKQASRKGSKAGGASQVRPNRGSMLQTATDAFKRWFGDSKVVDANGKPMVVYHGTRADFSAFNGSRFYFTPDPEYAGNYADNESGAQVMPVYLSLQNPLDLRSLGSGRLSETTVLNALSANGVDVDGLRGRVKSKNDKIGVWAWWHDSEVRAAVKAAGYDSAIQREETRAGRTTAYIAFEPTQIKSAIGNNGNFDPNKSDIRYNRATPPSVAKAESAIAEALAVTKESTRWTAIRTMFTKDLVNAAKKVLPSAEKYYDAMVKVQTERTKAEREVSDILEAFRGLSNVEQGTGPSSVNALLKDSTMSKKWAFKPDWLADDVEVDAVLAQRFSILSSGAQALVKRVFKHGHDNLQAMQRAVVDNTNSEYDGVIAELDAAGDTKAADKLRAEKAKSLSDFQSLLKLRSGWPYAPLKRFGNHVVMAVSKAYKDARDAGDTKLMQELQENGDHYYVSFADTAREARRTAESLEASYPDGEVGSFERAPDADLFMGGRDMLGAFKRLRKLAQDTDTDGDAKVTARTNELMRTLYLTLLSETSARKGEIHRKNVAGADKDMMRAFATQGRATAHFLAGLRSDGDVQDQLMAMRKEAGKTLTGRSTRQAYFNELMRRHAMNLEYQPSGLIDKAMGFTSVWTLLSNPSYFLVNALQPGMMSQPLMAAKFGYGRSWGELNRAYRELLPLLRGGVLNDQSYSKLPADVRAAMSALADKGAIHISLDQDVGRFESSEEGPMKILGSVTEKLRGVSERIESMNRLSTAIAAYRMMLAEKGSSEAAIEYAAKVIYETHGDYSGFNSPRFMRQGVMRLATQFRKFQLIQLSMFARFVHQAFKGATPNERAVGRWALAFNLAHLAVMGGAMGLPGFTAIAWIVGKAFPDDDEPDDPEATLRRILGEDNKFIADMLIKGVPKALGVDLSGRVGAGGMLSIAPYADLDLSRKGYAETAVSLLGPFAGGLLPRAADGLGQMAKGDYYKGLEQLMPTGLANIAKGARFAVDGVTSRKGEQLLTADEIGILDGLAQAVGLPTNTITDRNAMAGSLYKAETFYKDRTAQLKKDYVEAVKSNDAEAMTEARADWTALQEAKRGLGFKPSPLSDLLKAPQEMRKREANVVAGVSAKKESAGFLRQLSE